MTNNKMLTALTGVLIAALAGGLGFAALTIRDLTADLAELKRKVAKGDAPAPAKPEAAPSEKAIPAGTGEVEALSARVDQLKKDLDSFIAAVGQGGAPAPDTTGTPATPGAKAPPKGDSSQQMLTDALASLSPQQQEAFKAAVLQVIDDREKEQQQQRAMEKKNAILDALAQKLGMTPTQKDNIRQVFNQATAKILQLRQSMNESNAEQVKTEIGQTLQQADTAIRAQLTVEQTAQYEQWTQSEGRGIFGAAGAKPPKQGK